MAKDTRGSLTKSEKVAVAKGMVQYRKRVTAMVREVVAKAKTSAEKLEARCYGAMASWKLLHNLTQRHAAFLLDHALPMYSVAEKRMAGVHFDWRSDILELHKVAKRECCVPAGYSLKKTLETLDTVFVSAQRKAFERAVREEGYTKISKVRSAYLRFKLFNELSKQDACLILDNLCDVREFLAKHPNVTIVNWNDDLRVLHAKAQRHYVSNDTKFRREPVKELDEQALSISVATLPGAIGLYEKHAVFMNPISRILYNTCEFKNILPINSMDDVNNLLGTADNPIPGIAAVIARLVELRCSVYDKNFQMVKQGDHLELSLGLARLIGDYEHRRKVVSRHTPEQKQCDVLTTPPWVPKKLSAPNIITLSTNGDNGYDYTLGTGVAVDAAVQNTVVASCGNIDKLVAERNERSIK